RRDFVPWPFTDDGRRSAWLASWVPAYENLRKTSRVGQGAGAAGFPPKADSGSHAHLRQTSTCSAIAGRVTRSPSSPQFSNPGLRVTPPIANGRPQGALEPRATDIGIDPGD